MTEAPKREPIVEKGWFWRLAWMLGLMVGGLLLYRFLTTGSFGA
jgi:hypothetical protein